MAAIQLDQVVKRFGAFTAVDGVSLAIEPGEFFSLLGPSGCGKTTLLRMMAGFETPTEGRILFGETDVTRLPPQRRPTAMVFQNYALFPTMTVGQNVGYGLEVQKVLKAERAQRVQKALARVDLDGLQKKPVTQLSGGQQQRVALARAIAIEPEVLLFDEPLSNLDVALREQTRRELTQLQQQLGITSVYVTHDQQEALALSDRIAVMRAGQIQQVGPPEALYREPETAFVAQFLGGSNLIADGVLAEQLAGEAPPTERPVLAVRPEHLTLDDASPIRAEVRARQFLGMFAELELTLGALSLRAWVDPTLVIADTVGLRATAHRWVRDA
ncbi:MAG: ABC transporter ATP-binding protein [Rhodothermales bacterium]